MNNIALSLTISIIILSFIVIIINCTSSYNIFSQFRKLSEQKIVFYNSKRDNILSILSFIFIDIIWFIILLLWIADLVRIKIKVDDTFYNYLKIRAFKKNFYLFKEENNKESKEKLHNLDNKNKIIKNKKSNNLSNYKFSVNNLIEDNNTNISNIDIKNNNVHDINISNVSNKSNQNNSMLSGSLNDSYQKPVNMIIIGTDEKGFPIYKKQNSFDKTQISNESDSFSNRDKNFNQNNFIQFNDINLNVEDTLNDIENINYEKNHILEKDNDEIPKKVENANENENENENDNNNDYKDHFIPLESGENEKEVENKDNDEQK